jgi:hypothetical protein
MRKLTKVLALLLAVFMLCSCLIACANENDPNKDPSGNPVTPPDDGNKPGTNEQLKPDIPETYDFEQAEVSFLYWYVQDWTNTVRYCRDIYSEDVIGEPIPDKVYYRNADIEEAYNVKITLEMQKHDVINGTIDTMRTSGDDTYLITVPRLLEQANLIEKDCFLNLYEVKYIDLEKPWWDQNSVSQLSTNGMLNLVATALMVNDKDATAALAFNKQAVLDYTLDSPYELVENNNWTYATLAQLAGEATDDLDGNEEMDETDFWGFLGKNDVSTSFFHGCGGLFVSKDEDDKFVFSFGEGDYDYDATFDLYDEIMDADFFYNHHKTGINDDEYTELFTSGHGLFFWMRLDEVTNMRNSDTEFGILPIPKYEADQKNYHSTVSPHTTGLLSIPISTTGEALDMVGMILEAMSAHSYYDLQNEYVEVSLKTRYARDDESEAMLDIILNNRVFDPGVIFNFGRFADEYQNDIPSGENIVTLYSTLADKTREAIDEFNEKILG